jgi:multimeric flavodoxin WrbA
MFLKYQMKILSINSSHRGDKGFTRFLIDKIFEGASNAGAECENTTLAKMKINRCIGCQICHTQEHFLQCVYENKDDVKSIFNKMKTADIVIFATPVYVFSMSGLMKIFLDRINSTGDSGEFTVSEKGLFFHHINKEIFSKPFAVLVTCDNLEDETPKNVLSFFKTYSRFMDAPMVGTLIRKSGKMMGYGKIKEREKQFPKINDIYKAFYDAGKELATIGKIKTRTQNRAKQYILPIPFLSILIKLGPFKKVMANKAKEMMKTF